MVNHNRRERKKAPCGCAAADKSDVRTKYPQQYSITCPAMRSGRIRQHGTDLQIPLNHPHIEYLDALHYQTPEMPLSWQSGSTQGENYNADEGYSRFNQDGLGATFGLPLTPEIGVNLNEPRQMEQAALQYRARAISEITARFFEPEQQDDIAIDENGNAVLSSSRSVRMGPSYFQPPTRSYDTEAAQYSNPSSRGQSSSHRSGRRSIQDQSSSGRGQAGALVATGEQFADFADQAYEDDLSVSGYDIEDESVFQFEN